MESALFHSLQRSLSHAYDTLSALLFFFCHLSYTCDVSSSEGFEGGVFPGSPFGGAESQLDLFRLEELGDEEVGVYVEEVVDVVGEVAGTIPPPSV